jgi:hypothetical protein
LRKEIAKLFATIGSVQWAAKTGRSAPSTLCSA